MLQRTQYNYVVITLKQLRDRRMLSVPAVQMPPLAALLDVATLIQRQSPTAFKTNIIIKITTFRYDNKFF